MSVFIDGKQTIEAAPQTGTTRDFSFEVGKGNVPGHEFVLAAGENDAIGGTFINLTDVGGTDFFAESPESWELVSTDANDTLGGTGANLVIFFVLDAGLVKKTVTVFTNGGTVVLPDGLDYLRARLGVVGLSGSNKVNVGDLILRVAGGGTERARILAGNSVTRIGAYTVPAGHIAVFTNTPVNPGINDDIEAKLLTYSPDTNTINSNAVLHAGGGSEGLESYPVPLPEKTDYWIQVKKNGGGSSVFALGIISMLEIDMNFL